MKNLIIISLVLFSLNVNGQSKWHYYLSDVKGERSVSPMETTEDSTQGIEHFYILSKDTTPDSIYFYKQNVWVGSKVIEFRERVDSDSKIDYYDHRYFYTFTQGNRKGFVPISMMDDSKVVITSTIDSEDQTVRDTSFIISQGVIKRQLLEVK